MGVIYQQLRHLWKQAVKTGIAIYAHKIKSAIHLITC